MTVVDCLRGFLGRSNQCWHSLQLEFGNIIVNKDLKREYYEKNSKYHFMVNYIIFSCNYKFILGFR